MRRELRKPVIVKVVLKGFPPLALYNLAKLNYILDFECMGEKKRLNYALHWA